MLLSMPPLFSVQEMPLFFHTAKGTKLSLQAKLCLGLGVKQCSHSASFFFNLWQITSVHIYSPWYSFSFERALEVHMMVLLLAVSLKATCSRTSRTSCWLLEVERVFWNQSCQSLILWGSVTRCRQFSTSDQRPDHVVYPFSVTKNQVRFCRRQQIQPVCLLQLQATVTTPPVSDLTCLNFIEFFFGKPHISPV